MTRSRDRWTYGRIPDGWTYFIQPENEPHAPIKIGRTLGDPYQRLEMFQIGCPVNLWFLVIIPGADCELDFHTRFDIARLRGEWFEPIPNLVAEIHDLQREFGVPEWS